MHMAIKNKSFGSVISSFSTYVSVYIISSPLIQEMKISLRIFTVTENLVGPTLHKAFGTTCVRLIMVL